MIDDREVFLEEEHVRLSQARNTPYYIEKQKTKKRNGIIVAVTAIVLCFILIFAVSNRKVQDEDTADPLDPKKVKVSLKLLDFSQAPDFTVYGPFGAKFESELYNDPIFGGPIVPFTKTRRNETTIREIQNSLSKQMENHLALKDKKYGYFVIKNMILDSEVTPQDSSPIKRVDLWFQAYDLDENEYKLLLSLNNTFDDHNLNFTHIRHLINGFGRKIYYYDSGELISCHEGTFTKGLHNGFGRIIQHNYSVKSSIGYIVDNQNLKFPFDFGLELVNALPIGKGIAYKNINPDAKDIYEGMWEDDLSRHFSQQPTLRKEINSFEEDA